MDLDELELLRTANEHVRAAMTKVVAARTHAGLVMIHLHRTAGNERYADSPDEAPLVSPRLLVPYRKLERVVGTCDRATAVLERIAPEQASMRKPDGRSTGPASGP